MWDLLPVGGERLEWCEDLDDGGEDGDLELGGDEEEVLEAVEDEAVAVEEAGVLLGWGGRCWWSEVACSSRTASNRILLDTPAFFFALRVSLSLADNIALRDLLSFLEVGMVLPSSSWARTTALRACWSSPSSSCLLYTSPSPRDKRQSRMPSSA